MSIVTRSGLLGTLGAAVALLGSAASAQSVAPLMVTPKAPTEVRITLAGKTPKYVRKEIRRAANTVCFNAVLNGDLHFTDYVDCATLSRRKALNRYAGIRSGRSNLADVGVLRLALR